VCSFAAAAAADDDDDDASSIVMAGWLLTNALFHFTPVDSRRQARFAIYGVITDVITTTPARLFVCLSVM